MVVAGVAHADPLAPAGLPPVPGDASAALAQPVGGDVVHGVVSFLRSCWLMRSHGRHRIFPASVTRTFAGVRSWPRRQVPSSGGPGVGARAAGSSPGSLGAFLTASWAGGASRFAPAGT